MADDLLNVADVLKLDNKNLANIDVSDVLDEAPMLRRLYAMPATRGTQHEYLKKTQNPQASFRSVNDGVEYDHTEEELVTLTLKVLEASVRVDKALADAYTGGAEALITKQAKNRLRDALVNMEAQILYGVGNDAGGFAGFADNAALDGLDDAMVIDAGGGGTESCTSAWLIRTGEDDVAALFGNDGNLEVGNLQIIEAAGSTTGFLPCYYIPTTGFAGVQLGSAYSVARICNIDEGNPLTDDLIFEALSAFPSSRPPNLIVVSRTGLRYLRENRTEYHPLGQPAPFPTDIEGIPLITSDRVSDNEDVVT